jgi:hypothetical protein
MRKPVLVRNNVILSILLLSTAKRPVTITAAASQHLGFTAVTALTAVTAVIAVTAVTTVGVFFYTAAHWLTLLLPLL